MNLKTILASTIAMFAASALSAQVLIGPELGITHTTMDMSINGNQYNNKFVVGARVGAAFDIPVKGLFYLQPSVSFGFMHGGKGNYGEFYRLGSGVPAEYSDERSYRLYSIQIPILFTAKTNFTYHPNNFTFGIGPYLNFNYGGQYSRTHATTLNGLDRQSFDDRGIRVGAESVAHDIRPIEIGAMGAIGYEMSFGLNIKAYYGIGFNNVAPTGGGVTNRLRSYGGGLVLSYYINHGERY